MSTVLERMILRTRGPLSSLEPVVTPAFAAVPPGEPGWAGPAGLGGPLGGEVMAEEAGQAAFRHEPDLDQQAGGRRAQRAPAWSRRPLTGPSGHEYADDLTDSSPEPDLGGLAGAVPARPAPCRRARTGRRADGQLRGGRSPTRTRTRARIIADLGRIRSRGPASNRTTCANAESARCARYPPRHLSGPVTRGPDRQPPRSRERRGRPWPARWRWPSQVRYPPGCGLPRRRVTGQARRRRRPGRDRPRRPTPDPRSPSRSATSRCAPRPRRTSRAAGRRSGPRSGWPIS